MVDGIQWAVVRSVGIGRQHFAVRDVDLEAVESGDLEPAGIESVPRSSAAGVLSQEVAALVSRAFL